VGWGRVGGRGPGEGDCTSMISLNIAWTVLNLSFIWSKTTDSTLNNEYPLVNSHVCKSKQNMLRSTYQSGKAYFRLFIALAQIFFQNHATNSLTCTTNSILLVLCNYKLVFAHAVIHTTTDYFCAFNVRII